MIRRIFVIPSGIRTNARKQIADECVCLVRCNGTDTRGHEMVMTGPSKLVYEPHSKKDCIGRVWIETEHPVDVLDKRTGEIVTI